LASNINLQKKYENISNDINIKYSIQNGTKIKFVVINESTTLYLQIKISAQIWFKIQKFSGMTNHYKKDKTSTLITL